MHIGMHKTGTTAIQTALEGYDDGTTAYLTLFDPNHSYGMALLFCEEQAAELVSAGWAKSMADWHQKADANLRRLQEQVTSGRQNLIISGEELSARFGIREVERLRAAFAPQFDDIRVVVYLREPHAYLRSALQEVLKGQPCTLASAPFPDYRQRLEPWETVFGRDAMDYVLFAPDTLAGQDAVGDFAARVGVTRTKINSNRANESMSAEVFAMLYLLRNGPSVSKWAWPDARLQAVGQQYRKFEGRRFAIAASVWQVRLAAGAEDIAWAEDRLGQRFASERTQPDAVVFRSEAEILEFAAANTVAISQWAKQIMPFRRVVLSYLENLQERV